MILIIIDEADISLGTPMFAAYAERKVQSCAREPIAYDSKHASKVNNNGFINGGGRGQFE